MARATNKIMGYLGDAFKLAIVALLMGGILYFFFGDKIKRAQKLQNVTMHYEVLADDKLEAPVNSHISGSVLWKTYFNYLPEEELSEEKYMIQVQAQFRREENPSTQTDGNGTSRSYSPGKLMLRLRTRQKGRETPLYSRSYDFGELEPLLIAQVDEVISAEKRDREYVRVENNIINQQLADYLDLAIIRMMEKRSDLHNQYAEVVALTGGHRNEELAKASYSVFKNMTLTPDTLKKIEAQVKRERLKVRGTPRETGLKKIQEHIEEQLK